MLKSKKKNILLIFIICLLTGCGNSGTEIPITKTTAVMSIPQLHNGDAKFYNNNIITSLNNVLTLINLEGEIIKTYDEIKSNWIDSVSEDGVIIYGNFNKEIGIIKLDEKNNVVSNTIIMTTENLHIDPTITKIEDDYYITITEIIGAVNNADPTIENGRYIIHIYKSENLQDWSFVGDVADENNNLEDVDLFYEDRVMYVMYEKEVVDRGNSAIYIQSSEDMGKSWEAPILLLGADCDHEPVTIMNQEDGYIVYYSCDEGDLGQSYMGSKAYYALYDESFHLLKKDIEIQTETNVGILWYDISEINEKRYVIFAKNYLTDCDMVVEMVN